MSTGQSVVLVESNFRRRAAISHCLAGTSIHVEPFESVEEMRRRWPHGTIVLVGDEDEVIHDLFSAMTDREQAAVGSGTRNRRCQPVPESV